MPSYIAYIHKSFKSLAELQYEMARIIKWDREISFGGLIIGNTKPECIVKETTSTSSFFLVQASYSMESRVNGSVFVQHPLVANFAGVLKRPHAEECQLWCIANEPSNFKPKLLTRSEENTSSINNLPEFRQTNELPWLLCLLWRGKLGLGEPFQRHAAGPMCDINCCLSGY